MNDTVIVGIDPGLSGGLALLRGNSVLTHVMPVISGGKRRELDLPTIAQILRNWKPDFVVVEKVASRPGQGVASMFSMGRGLGMLEGLLTGLGVSFQLVGPKTWKAKVLAGTARDKQAALTYCKRRWPGVSWKATSRCRVDHDGLADAACMAAFGQRYLLGSKDQDAQKAS